MESFPVNVVEENVMNLKGSFIFVLVFLFSLVLFSSLVLAEDGCFIDKGSSNYCTSLSDVEAQEECSFSDTCELNSDFLEGKDCSFVEDCQKILCKSSCKVEFSGQCPFGEVPLGKEKEWCSSGCCQFTFGNQEYCQSTPGQWKCEVEAINRDQTNYGFESNPNCESSCKDFTYQAVLQEVSVSKKQFTTLLLKKSKTPVKQETSLPKEVKKEEEGGFSFFWWILIIGIAIFIAVKWKSWFKPSEDDFVDGPSAFKSPDFLSPFLSNPFTKSRIKKIKREHKHKRKEQRMENLFGEAGLKLPQESKPSQNFEELKKRISSTKKPLKNTSVLKLNRIARERERKKKSTFNSAKRHKKNEQEEVFSKLRKLSRKKR